MTRFINVEFAHRVREDWPRVLDAILERARSLGARAVLAFDLDSTLFDNRPRQARILREFGEAHGHRALAACTADHWENGFDLKGAMRRCGVTDPEIENLAPQVKRFWADRFFTSEYCVDDVEIDGAAEFLREVHQTGAQIAYVTGRPEAMRDGTVEAMRKCGIVLPGERVFLMLKPPSIHDDDEWKRVAHTRIRELGEVVAAFDNEPTHANDYSAKFPQATVIHLATDHSGRPVPLADGIVSVPHWEWRKR